MGGKARVENEKPRGQDSGQGDTTDAPGPPQVPRLARGSHRGAGPPVPGREDASTHLWARWRVPGEGRRPPAPGALGRALSEAVGRAHGGARAKHRPERPAAGRERRENGPGWPLPGPVAEAGPRSRDAGGRKRRSRTGSGAAPRRSRDSLVAGAVHQPQEAALHGACLVHTYAH